VVNLPLVGGTGTRQRVAGAIALAAGALAAVAWSAPEALDPLAVAERLLAGPRARQGALAVRARLEEAPGEEASEAGRMPATLEALLPGVTGPTRIVRLSLVSMTVEGTSELWQREVTGAAEGDGRPWLIQVAVELPEDFGEAALVVEDVVAGLWGATRAEIGAPPLPGGDAVRVDDLRPPPGTPAPAAATALVRLVPPRRRPVVGRVRLHALTGSEDIVRLVFLVDGREVAADDREPYSQVVELGEAVAPHELAVVAFGADGSEVGRDLRRVNAPSRAFDVAVASVQSPGGPIVVAAVTVPPERQLESVELYRNEELLASRTAPPFEAPLPQREVGPADYVRAVATLDDGTSLDDVVLLDPEAMGERVEVNLVQVFAVVTNRSGEPVRDLGPTDFVLSAGGAGRRRDVPIESFAHAGDLPLDLGLVFDSSESMATLMPEAKQAGATFLARAMRPGDRSFLVDFDTRPRLAQRPTGDVGEVLRSFGRLEAGGATALYDAVLFAMLQFEPGPGRKALVVLTDGEEYGSRLSGGRCVDVARETGVPVYIVDLTGLLDPAHAVPKLELEALAEPTGGRVYVTTDLERLTAAYDQILAELRSQYLLAFATEGPLSGEELAAIEVDVRGRGLRVRRVVGSAGG
jgi:VWFA-related protein